MFLKFRHQKCPQRKRLFTSLKFQANRDYERWSDKILLQGNDKGYKKLMVEDGSKIGVNKILIQDMCEESLEGENDYNKIVRLGKINKIVYDDLIFSIQ